MKVFCLSSREMTSTYKLGSSADQSSGGSSVIMSIETCAVFLFMDCPNCRVSSLKDHYINTAVSDNALTSSSSSNNHPLFRDKAYLNRQKGRKEYLTLMSPPYQASLKFALAEVSTETQWSLDVVPTVDSFTSTAPAGSSESTRYRLVSRSTPEMSFPSFATIWHSISSLQKKLTSCLMH